MIYESCLHERATLQKRALRHAGRDYNRSVCRKLFAQEVEIQMNKNRKTKAVLMVLAMSSSLLLAACGSSARKLDVPERKVMELGQKVVLTPQTFVAADTDEDLLDDIELTSDLTTSPKYDYTGFTYEVKSKDKDCLEKGTYEVTLSLDGVDYPVQLVIEDTTAPTFVSPAASIAVNVGEKESAITKGFKADDLDEVKISLSGDYDLNKAGTYNIKVVASDPSGNKAEHPLKLRVIGDSEIITSEDDLDSVVIPEPVEPEPEKPETETPSQTPDTQTPAEETPSGSEGNDGNKPGACTVSKAPAGTQIYYSFEEAYAAGTAWVKQGDYNYFFYTIGTDDCGNTVYCLTLGSAESADGIPH